MNSDHEPSRIARLNALKSSNAMLNREEYRRGARTLSSLPRYIMIELTQGCNLSCPMCRPHTIRYKDRLMDRSIVSRISDQLFPTAEMVDVRGWGESLLAPDIDQIISLVASYEARCRIVTNLSVNRPKTLNLLVDVGAMIDVSLDTSDIGQLEQSRPGSNLGLITSNLSHIALRLSESGKSSKSLRVIVTLQSTTLASLSELITFLGTLGVRNVVLNEVTVSKDNPVAVTNLRDRVDTAVAQAVGAAKSFDMALTAGTALGNSVKATKNLSNCVHPWAYATVGYDGSVGYCDHLIGAGMSRYCLGNTVTQPFLDIWNGVQWQDLRSWHHEGPNRKDCDKFGACFDCYKHRNVDFEYVFDPSLEATSLSVSPLT